MPAHGSSKILRPFSEILLESGNFLLESRRHITQRKVLSTEVMTGLSEKHRV